MFVDGVKKKNFIYVQWWHKIRWYKATTKLVVWVMQVDGNFVN